MLVDSHCHFNLLNLDLFPEKIPGILNQAKSLGVEFFLNVGTEPQNWQAVIDIANHYNNIWASVGLHPSDAVPEEPSAEMLIEYAQQQKVVAIGETGLDYYHTDVSKELQHERFRRHIQVAKKLGKPLIIHTRQAQDDTIKILQEEGASEVGGVMHCFTESWEMAKAAMDLNFLISFSGIVTFKKALELKEVAKKVPLNMMLVETDAPFLTPEPYRGKPNQPAFVYYVAQYLSKLCAIPFEKLCEQTSENFFRVFKLNIS